MGLNGVDQKFAEPRSGRFYLFIYFLIHRQVITGNRSDSPRASPAERGKDRSDYMRNIKIRKVCNNKVCCEATQIAAEAGDHRICQ